MDNTNLFFQEPTVNIILFIFGIIGWVFGIISTILTIKNSVDQRKREKAYSLLLEQASLDWEGKYTKEQINELKKQFNNLHNQIESEIPKLAKRILLESQAENLKDSISTQYHQLIEISDKLKDKPALANLPSSIKKDIENEIIPYHIKKQKKNRTSQIFIIIILVLLILPFISEYIFDILYIPFSFLPFRLDDLITYLLCGIMFVIVIFLFFPNKNIEYSRKTFIKYIILGIALLLGWMAIISEVIFEYIQLPRLFEIVGSFISYVPLSLAIRHLYTALRSFKMNLRYSEKKDDKNVNS